MPRAFIYMQFRMAARPLKCEIEFREPLGDLVFSTALMQRNLLIPQYGKTVRSGRNAWRGHNLGTQIWGEPLRSDHLESAQPPSAGHSAWEDGDQLKTKNMAFTSISFWR